jgi:hypothetical protein
MSLRAPSLMGLVGVLQQHGLTWSMIAACVAACRAQHSGTVIFQVAEGRIRSVTVEGPKEARQLAHD